MPAGWLKQQMRWDLADLYGVETKRLIQQVKRNIERFPGDFMFQLDRSEVAALRSHIATSNSGLEQGLSGHDEQLNQIFKALRHFDLAAPSTEAAGRVRLPEGEE
jgi:hypothetical protein